MTTHQTEIVALASLRPHPRNYRSHPEDQLAHIQESIRQHGFYRNIVITRDGTILAGHGVALAAGKMGVAEVPVVRLDLGPDDAQALKILAADNELGKFSENDDRMLSELLREIKDHDVNGLLGTGFDDQALAALVMVTRPASEIQGFDAAAEWVGMPAYDRSDDQKYACKLTMCFTSEENRAKFIEQNKLKAYKPAGEDKAWSSVWPPEDREDLRSLRFGKK